jgi:hypothetical protein
MLIRKIKIKRMLRCSLPMRLKILRPPKMLTSKRMIKRNLKKTRTTKSMKIDKVRIKWKTRRNILPVRIIMTK